MKHNIDDLLDYATGFDPETPVPGINGESFQLVLDKNCFSTIDAIRKYQFQYNVAIARLEAILETEKLEKERDYEKWAKVWAQEVRTSRV